MQKPDEYLKSIIRNLPDFPSPGVIFRDITPLLANPDAFSKAIDWYCEQIEQLSSVQKIIAIESRGFIFGSAIADRMGLGLVPVRKKGKLPYKTISVKYKLEYGIDTLEIHVDALQPKEEVIILDDLLATGGTAGATLDLVQKTQAITIGALFLIELSTLKGRSKVNTLDSKKVVSLIKY